MHHSSCRNQQIEFSQKLKTLPIAKQKERGKKGALPSEGSDFREESNTHPSSAASGSWATSTWALAPGKSASPREHQTHQNHKITETHTKKKKSKQSGEEYMVEKLGLLGVGDEAGDVEEGRDGADGVVREAPQRRRRRRRWFLGRLVVLHCCCCCLESLDFGVEERRREKRRQVAVLGSDPWAVRLLRGLFSVGVTCVGCIAWAFLLAISSL